MLYLAYDYAGYIGLPVSAVLDLPIEELYGYVAYQKIKSELINNGN